MKEYDSRREALLDNIQSDENREDLTLPAQARKWSKAVRVDYVEEGQRYFGYVNELGDNCHSESLHIPSRSMGDVKRIAKGTEYSAQHVSRVVSYILYPEHVQENIGERGGLSKTVAYTVPSRCTDVENAQKALELIAELGEYFEGKGGIDSEKRDIINWSIKQANETGEVSVWS